MENGKLRISQCMIVKNEESNIEKALSWGKGIMWEQIVVDTGSTDWTVELAERMGAKIYHFQWIDDFSAAKNYAISKAKGDWIAFLDADETFSQEDAEKLSALLGKLKDTRTEAIVTAWMQLDDEGGILLGGTQIRVFRNKPGIRYRRRIHEQLEWADRRPMRVYDATQELSILHTGYQSAASTRKTVSRRNLNLILEELKEHPEDHEMMGYLGDEYHGAGKRKEAMEWYRKSIEAMPPRLSEGDERSAATFTYLLAIQMDEERPEEELMAVYEKAVRLLPKEADFDCVMGKYFLSHEDFCRGSLYLGQALSKLEQYGCNSRAMYTASHLGEIYKELAFCSLKNGELQGAISFSVAVLKTDLYDMQALGILLQAFSGNEEVPAVGAKAIAGFLGKLYHLEALKDRLVILRTAEKVGSTDLAEYVRSLFTAEELACIDREGKP